MLSTKHLFPNKELNLVNTIQKIDLELIIYAAIKTKLTNPEKGISFDTIRQNKDYIAIIYISDTNEKFGELKDSFEQASQEYFLGNQNQEIVEIIESIGGDKLKGLNPYKAESLMELHLLLASFDDIEGFIRQNSRF